jgi:hypothetical protein
VLFGAIFEWHFVPIHRYLNRRVGLDLAEDLASETLPSVIDEQGSLARVTKTHHPTECPGS